MLLQFTLTNYKNFRDTTVLDLTEAKITEFPQHLLTNQEDNLSVLPVVAIYGPNGSGKSNFLQAFAHLRELVLDAPSAMKKMCSFAFDEHSKDIPTEYEVIFRTDDMEYEYQLKIQENKVVKENLYGRKFSQSSFDVLFDYDKEGVFLCPAWENTDVKDLTEQTPLLYFLGQNTSEPSLEKILNVFKNVIILTGSSKDEIYLTQTLQDQDLKKSLLTHLSAMNFSITDLTLQDDRIMATETKNGVSRTCPWSELSIGIHHLLTVLSALLVGKTNGSLILADDPEIYLHPKALAYLIRFASDCSSNLYGSQLLMTTHENSTMNNSLFRRDELWLVDSSSDGSSILYTLALYLKENGEKVRKDETYFKQYLEGRYDACPQI